MIEFERAGKRFGDTVAVEELSFAVEEGTLFSLIGPNGAGKTTTIKMMCGLLAPTSGAVRLFGHDIVQDAKAAKGLLGYVPDEPHIYDKLTGREFMELVGRMHGMGRRELSRRIAEAIERLDLGGFADELAGAYSHGMTQRCALGAALVHSPRLFLVDEPMVGLDPRSIRTIKEVLLDYVRAGNIVFMSTHDLADVEEMSDCVGVLCDGKLMALGDVAAVKRQTRSQRLEDGFLALTEALP